MVFEIDLEPGLAQDIRDAVEGLVKTRLAPARALGYEYPGLFLAYVVGEASRNYRHGALWPNLPVQGLDNGDLSQAFEPAVERFSLEPFKQLADAGHRYVTPILAHGGIPAFCAGDFWTFLLEELGDIPGADADELMRRWRSRPSLFDGFDKPVGRFLLFGADVARNFLDRCIDLLSAPERDGRDYGLPSHIVEAFWKLDRKRLPTAHRGQSMPRPRFVLDPWDRLGPHLELPGVAAEFGAAGWTVTHEGATPREVVASRDRQTVPVGPSKNWHVNFVAALRAPRPFAFDGTPSGVLVFDPATGDYQSGTRAVVLDDAWLLTPPDVSLLAQGTAGTAEPLHITEHLGRLGGQWSRHNVVRADLRNVESLQVQSGDGTKSTLRVLPPGQRTRLKGDPMAAAVTENGLDIYSTAPEIEIPRLPGVGAERWSIEVATSSGSQRKRLSELGGLGSSVAIAKLLSPTYLGEVGISVLGPLGYDLRASFALVPGLKVTVPDGVLLPGDLGNVSVEAAAGISIDGRAGAVSIPAQSDVGDVRITIARESKRLNVRVRIPRLSWALQGTELSAAFASAVLETEAGDIKDRRIEALVIATERTGQSVRLVLRDEATELQASEWATTSGERGRWRFPLQEFTQTLAGSDAPRPSLEVQVGSRSVITARVRSRVQVSDFGARMDVGDDNTRLLRLGYSEEHAIRGRVAFLWPLDRPWNPPATSHIPDGITGKAFFDPAAVPPGRYRAEVREDVGWLEPKRPSRARPNTGDIAVSGTPKRVSDEDDELGRALAGMRRPKGLGDDVIARRVPELLLAIDFLVGETEDKDSLPRATFAARLLLAAPSAYEVLVRLMKSGETPRDSISRLAVLAMPLKPAFALPDDVLAALWSACSPVAASFDIPAARLGSARAVERCKTLGGWTVVDGLPQPVDGMGHESWIREWAARSPDQIRSMAQFKRVQDPALSPFAYQTAGLEWVANAKDNTGAMNQWWDRYGEGLRGVRQDCDPRMRNYISRRAKADYLPGTAGTPQAILAACDAVIACDYASSRTARIALLEVTKYASRLIDHDITLAILVANSPASEWFTVIDIAQPIATPPAQSVPVKTPAAQPLPPPKPVDSEANRKRVRATYGRLLAWREKVYKRREFLIFSDEDLRQLAEARPRTVDEVSALVGDAKGSRFGQEIADVIWRS